MEASTKIIDYLVREIPKINQQYRGSRLEADQIIDLIYDFCNKERIDPEQFSDEDLMDIIDGANSLLSTDY